MKVLIISEYFPPNGMGGGEISAYLLAKGLAKTKIDVSVLTSNFKGLRNFEKKEGIKIYRRLKTGKDPSSLLSNIKRTMCYNKSLKEVVELDRENNFDIIHCMNLTSVSALRFRDEINKKFIAHVNSPLFACPKGDLIQYEKPCEVNCSLSTFLPCFICSKEAGKIKNRWFLRFNPLFWLIVYRRFKKIQKNLKGFNHIIATSTFIKERLNRMGFENNKISVVPNIVELKPFLTVKSKKNKIPKILYLGAYVGSKGPQILLEALKRIKEPYECNMYGSGVLREKLEGYVKDNKLNVKINDKVPYSEIPSIMGEHDVVVFPSIVAEGFGRIAIEAMAAGKVVVASRIGGMKDIIKHNDTGLLVKPVSISDLKKSLELVIRDNKLRKRLENNKTVVKENFSPKNVSDRMKRLYGQVLRKYRI